MKPIEFPQQTGCLGGIADEEAGSKYMPMPCHQAKHAKTKKRFVVSCWRMGWWERLRALVHGRVWVYVVSNSHSQPPMTMNVERNPFE